MFNITTHLSNICVEFKQFKYLIRKGLEPVVIFELSYALLFLTFKSIT